MIRDTSEMDYVGQLESLITEHRVSLFSHVNLNEEWQKHKLDWRAATEKKRKKLSLDSSETDDESRYRRNMEKLDDLLQTSYFTLQHNQGLEQEVVTRIRLDQAPFRGGSAKGLNDWNIIGSFCLFCEQLGHQELYFVSHNHTDFADSQNPSEIDPTIAKRFPSVNINYFRNYSDFFNNIEKSYQLVDLPKQPKQYSFSASNKSTKRDYKIIDSLFNTLNNIFGELSYTPPHLLSNLYPFALSETETAYYRNFAISTPNEKLFRFFESIEINDSNVIIKDPWFTKNCSDYEDKVKNIISRLNECLIHRISLRGSKKTINIPTLIGSPIERTEKSYYQLCLHEISEQNFDKSLQLRISLKVAYLQFQLGYLYPSYLINHQVRKLAKKRKQYTSYILATYNLVQIYEATKWMYPNDLRFSKQIIQTLSEIDVDTELNGLRSHIDPQVADMLYNHHMFYRAFEKITKLSNNISISYHKQLTGGKAYNSYTHDLISELFHIDSFLNENGLIFDHYTDFKDLFDNVIQGLLAAVAVKEGRGSRLDSLDDYLVAKIIRYGDRQLIMTHMRRYRVDVIPYTSNGSEFSFSTLSLNLFNNFYQDDFIKRYTISSRLRDMVKQSLENVLLLGCYLDLPECEKEIFAENAIRLYISNIAHQRISHFIQLVVEKVGHLLSVNTITSLIEFCMANFSRETIYILYNSLEILESKEDNILDDNMYESILSIKNEEFVDKLLYDEILICLAKLKNKTSQSKVIDIIKSRCWKEKNVYLTCLSITDGITQFKENDFLELVDHINYDNKYISNRSYDDKTNPTYSYREVDQFINICFRYNIRTDQKKFMKIYDLNLYYKWLVDMDNFDYESFDPEWILHLNTMYSFDKMATCKPLLKYLYKNKEGFKDERVYSAITEIYSRLI